MLHTVIANFFAPQDGAIGQRTLRMQTDDTFYRKIGIFAFANTSIRVYFQMAIVSQHGNVINQTV
jgi:hypothetical protein